MACWAPPGILPLRIMLEPEPPVKQLSWKHFLLLGKRLAKILRLTIVVNTEIRPVILILLAMEHSAALGVSSAHFTSSLPCHFPISYKLIFGFLLVPLSGGYTMIVAIPCTGDTSSSYTAS
jgi:hypothetical protein